MSYELVDLWTGEARPAICTGMGASWCPFHGTCTCDREAEEQEADPACPLHKDSSDHAMGAVE